MATISQMITLEHLPNEPKGENGLRQLRQPAAALGKRVQTMHDNAKQLSPTEASSAIATDQQQSPLPPSTPPWLKLKIFGAAFSFFCAGINDSILGPLIPYILISFSIGTGEVAIL